jgi:hypothetical protein
VDDDRTFGEPKVGGCNGTDVAHYQPASSKRLFRQNGSFLTPEQPPKRVLRYFFRLAVANGDGALPALIAAHRRLAASAIAFRPAALSSRFAGALTLLTEAPATILSSDFGGRPRRFVGPRNASIALDRRSRSVTSKATICSVCITWRVTLRAHFVQSANTKECVSSRSAGIDFAGGPCTRGLPGSAFRRMRAALEDLAAPHRIETPLLEEIGVLAESYVRSLLRFWGH